MEDAFRIILGIVSVSFLHEAIFGDGNWSDAAWRTFSLSVPLLICAWSITISARVQEINKRGVRTFFEKTLVGGYVDAATPVLAKNYVAHDFSRADIGEGIEAWAKAIRADQETTGDFKFTLDHQSAEGDKVATLWTATLTRVPDAPGSAEKGETFQVRGITISRVDRKNQIAEQWHAPWPFS